MSAKKSPKSGSKEGSPSGSKDGSPSSKDSKDSQKNSKDKKSHTNSRDNVNFLMRVCRTKREYKGFLEQLCYKSERAGGGAIQMAGREVGLAECKIALKRLDNEGGAGTTPGKGNATTPLPSSSSTDSGAEGASGKAAANNPLNDPPRNPTTNPLANLGKTSLGLDSTLSFSSISSSSAGAANKLRSPGKLVRGGDGALKSADQPFGQVKIASSGLSTKHISGFATQTGNTGGKNSVLRGVAQTSSDSDNSKNSNSSSALGGMKAALGLKSLQPPGAPMPSLKGSSGSSKGLFGAKPGKGAGKSGGAKGSSAKGSSAKGIQKLGQKSAQKPGKGAASSLASPARRRTPPDQKAGNSKAASSIGSLFAAQKAKNAADAGGSATASASGSGERKRGTLAERAMLRKEAREKAGTDMDVEPSASGDQQPSSSSSSSSSAGGIGSIDPTMLPSHGRGSFSPPPRLKEVNILTRSTLKQKKEAAVPTGATTFPTGANGGKSNVVDLDDVNSQEVQMRDVGGAAAGGGLGGGLGGIGIGGINRSVDGITNGIGELMGSNSNSMSGLGIKTAPPPTFQKPLIRGATGVFGRSGASNSISGEGASSSSAGVAGLPGSSTKFTNGSEKKLLKRYRSNNHVDDSSNGGAGGTLSERLAARSSAGASSSSSAAAAANASRPGSAKGRGLQNQGGLKRQPSANADHEEGNAKKKQKIGGEATKSAEERLAEIRARMAQDQPGNRDTYNAFEESDDEMDGSYGKKVNSARSSGAGLGGNTDGMPNKHSSSEGYMSASSNGKATSLPPQGRSREEQQQLDNKAKSMVERLLRKGGALPDKRKDKARSRSRSRNRGFPGARKASPVSFNKISDYKQFFANHRIPMVALIERQDFVRLKEEFDNFVAKPAEAGRILNEEERKKGMAQTDILMTDKEEIAAKILRLRQANTSAASPTESVGSSSAVNDSGGNEYSKEQSKSHSGSGSGSGSHSASGTGYQSSKSNASNVYNSGSTSTSTFGERFNPYATGVSGNRATSAPVRTGNFGGRGNSPPKVESQRELEIVREATTIANLREHERGWQFKALGLNPRTADKSDVAKSYKNYMRKFHPDKLVNMTGKHREVISKAMERIKRSRGYCEQELDKKSYNVPGIITGPGHKWLPGMKPKRAVEVCWEAPTIFEQADTLPIDRYIVQMHDPKYGKYLQVAVIETTYNERQPNAKREPKKFIFEEEHCPKLRHIFDEKVIKVQVAAENRCGQGQYYQWDFGQQAGGKAKQAGFDFTQLLSQHMGNRGGASAFGNFGSSFGGSSSGSSSSRASSSRNPFGSNSGFGTGIPGFGANQGRSAGASSSSNNNNGGKQLTKKQQALKAFESQASDTFGLMTDVAGRKKFISNQKKGVKRDFLKQEGYPTLGRDEEIDQRVYMICVQKYG